jgi:hypothetical protein
MEMNGHIQTLTLSPLGWSLWYPLDMRGVGPRSGLHVSEENNPCLLMASHLTAGAIPADNVGLGEY